ncbi:MAG TPA: NUDIX domain-containing protein [Solirubrobacterales bacterium]|nr:NUDIX domain-containing protein [Solirubrobacterales bacterium]
MIGLDVFFIDPHDPRQGMLRLVESEQIFKAGGRRSRRLRTSLGEKQLPGETPEAAARRAIEEELGLPAKGLVLRSMGAEVMESKSESYPGLESTRHLTFFECALPQSLFHPNGYEERQDHKTVTFAWKACA